MVELREPASPTATKGVRPFAHAYAKALVARTARVPPPSPSSAQSSGRVPVKCLTRRRRGRSEPPPERSGAWSWCWPSGVRTGCASGVVNASSRWRSDRVEPHASCRFRQGTSLPTLRLWRSKRLPAQASLSATGSVRC